ncbi:BLUF domain-containing protein [Leucothrix arctica]|uniref:Phosphonate transporter n=1 Tax=Leucothrix arctica TaxID=1481894 RepID=A0A317CC52_9GAMM|nr:BLUF domain-containing protein [Leucothrix arctica]PWQ95681.1 phosphonate transporter [Leucothrix arctica]
MSNLFHLIYASQAVHEFSRQDIVELLSDVKQKNQQLDVHGMLLYDKGSFFHILEGDKEIIHDLFDQIVKDEKYQKVTKIIFEAIPKMFFSDWSMGYSSLSRSELEQMDGMNDFFVGQTCLSGIDQGRATKLLRAFSCGRWRST